MVAVRGTAILEEVIAYAEALGDPHPRMLDRLDAVFKTDQLDPRDYCVAQTGIFLALLCRREGP